MKHAKRFIADAGGYGVASVAAAFVFYGIALWEHFHDRPIPAFWLVAITVPLFWAGSVVAWWKISKELDHFKQQPDIIDVRLIEVFHASNDRYSEMIFDLFLRARLELKEKLEATSLNYTFELSTNGVSEPLEPKDDLDEWVLRTWKADTVLESSLNPLPHNLSLGKPVEGWLHCVTSPMTGEMLERCGIRLVVQSARNANYAEHDADPLIWNPRRETLVGRRW